MDTHKKIRVHLSALSDGELAPADLELALAALQSADGQQAWSTYHRIGDVLRANATPELSDAFLDRLNARLAGEAAPGRRAARAGEDKKIGTGALGKRSSSDPLLVGVAEGTEAADPKAVVKPKPAIASVS